MVWTRGPGKYGARRVGKHDSRKEKRRHDELQFLQRAGEIEDLRFHVRFPLESPDGTIRVLTPTGRVMFYEADFVYRDKRTGLEVVEDAKGFDTDVSRIKRAVLLALRGIAVRIV